MPGDKSITHRLYFLAAESHGRCIIKNPAQGADNHATQQCIHDLGVLSVSVPRRRPISFSGAAFSETLDREESEAQSSLDDDGSPSTIISGCGGLFTKPKGPLNAQNSGTTARLLMGILARCSFQSQIIGDASLSTRPMDRVAKPLEALGARIMTTDGKLPVSIDGYFPLQGGSCRGGSHLGDSLEGVRWVLEQASAQVKSALLFAGFGSDDGLTIIEPCPTRDHTERLMVFCGYPLHISKKKENQSHIRLDSLTKGKPFKNNVQKKGWTFTVPGDPSSAAYLASLGFIIPGTRLHFKNQSLNPSRIGYFRLLKDIGIQIDWNISENKMIEPSGDMYISSQNKRPQANIIIESKDIPNLIDELPLIAVLGTWINGITTVSGASELRYKECDRIKAICSSLSSMGADIDEREDGFSVKGPSQLQGTNLSSFGDHRIAMALVVAAMTASGESIIDGFDSIKISFPEFYEIIKEWGICS